MKRKKTPILLASLAGLFVVVMITLNLSQYLRNPGAIQEIEAPNKEALEKLQSRMDQGGTENVRPASATGIAKFGPGSIAQVEGGFAGIPAAPTIIVPDRTRQEPGFDSATTSSQWYDEESYQKVNAESAEGKRKGPN
jgi:hypothetical protein